MGLITREKIANRNNYGSERELKTIKYIVLHYTANDGDTDEANVNYFSSGIRRSSAHYYVDDDSISRSVKDNYIAWHCGGSLFNDIGVTGGAKYNNIATNDNSIGIEMCDTNKDGKHNISKETKENVIKLVRYLMDKYDIPIDKVIRHFDCTGKYCPMYFCPPYGSNKAWREFKDEIDKGDTDMIRIDSKSIINREQMLNYFNKVNKKLDIKVKKEIIDLYIEECNLEGINVGLAFCQSLIETGNYKFTGSAVKFEQYNFCGFGVIKSGICGESFKNMREGIRVQVQHLKAYANNYELLNTCIDNRFKYVNRGCARYIEWLGQKENPRGYGWATGKNYGIVIKRLYNKISNIEIEYKGTNVNCQMNVIVDTVGINKRAKPDINSDLVGFSVYGDVLRIEEVNSIGTWGKIKDSSCWIYLLNTKELDG